MSKLSRPEPAPTLQLAHSDDLRRASASANLFVSLMDACSRDDAAAAAALLSSPAMSLARMDMQPILNSAARHGSAACAKLLLPALPAPKAAARIALDTAAHFGQAAMCALFATLCDPKEPGAHSASPLLIAAERGHPEACAALAPFCDLDARDESGQNALMLACSQGSEPYLRCVEILASLCPPDAVDRRGWTALRVAIQDANEPAARILLPLSHATRLFASGPGKTLSTAAEAASRLGMARLAADIAAQALAQSERSDMEGQIAAGAPSLRAAAL